ncbi:MAG: hypothetical protein QOJ08_2429 [Ilumatobacteraceae bacterium]|jgi:predicted small metal-binding protein
MKQFACATVMPGCDGVVTGETEDDVLAAAAQHAASAHGITEASPELIDAVKAGITDV